jgi:hypothetical protein
MPTMKCPYCVSEIDQEAVACSHCTRDLYLFKPLLAQIAALEGKLRELEERATSFGLPQETEAVHEVAATAPESMAETALLWLSPLLLLLAAHVLITVVYDADTLWLRVVSLLIPFPFALTFNSRRWHHFGICSIAAFALAATAVLGMSGITHLVDQTPVLPQDRREWKEFIEYASSVAFSGMAGLALGRMIWRHGQGARKVHEAQGLTLRLAKLVSDTHDSAEKIQTMVTKINDIRGSLTTAAATAAALYTGLQGVLGSH